MGPVFSFAAQTGSAAGGLFGLYRGATNWARLNREDPSRGTPRRVASLVWQMLSRNTGYGIAGGGLAVGAAFAVGGGAAFAGGFARGGLRGGMLGIRHLLGAFVRG